MNNPLSKETVTQDMIDRVCAGVNTTIEEREAVWEYVRQLRNEVDDLKRNAKDEEDPEWPEPFAEHFETYHE